MKEMLMRMPKVGEVFRNNGVHTVMIQRGPQANGGQCIRDMLADEDRSLKSSAFQITADPTQTFIAQAEKHKLRNLDVIRDMVIEQLTEHGPAAQRDFFVECAQEEFDAAYYTFILEMPVVKALLDRNRQWRQNWWRNRALLFNEATTNTPQRNAKRGEPLFIVGSGPSLKKNAGQLANITHHNVLFANRIPEGVRHEHRIFFTTDYLCRERDGREFLAGVDVSTMTGILNLFCPPHIVSKAWGKRLWYRYGTSAVAEMKEARRFFKWITPLDVSCVSIYPCLNLALHWGCDPIIFVGQDLSYGPDHELHAGEKWVPRPEDKIVQLKDVFGKDVLADMGLFMAARSVQCQCQLQQAISPRIAGRRRRRFINATEGGILTKGVELMPLKEAVERWGR